MLKFVKQIEINLSICPKKANGGKIAGFGYFKQRYGFNKEKNIRYRYGRIRE